MKEKVFCISFHKTGTTSLGKFLEELGYKNIHGADPIRKKIGNRKMMTALFKREYDLIFPFVDEYDSFNDNPWFFIYPELDKKFPNSKFILVIRDEEDWLQSCIRYFGETTSNFRMFLYGKPNPIGNEKRYLEIYNNHNMRVLEYFKHRKNDLLVLNLSDSNKENKIKEFLKVKNGTTYFPKLNSTI